jgi:hypothetical protein
VRHIDEGNKALVGGGDAGAAVGAAAAALGDAEVRVASSVAANPSLVTNPSLATNPS